MKNYINKIKNKIMWVARDKDGTLVLLLTTPKRYENTILGHWLGKIDDISNSYSRSNCIKIPNDLFPNLKWEDEPLEVNITPVPSKEENMIDTVKEKFIKAYAEYYDYVSHKQDIRGYSEKKEEELYNESVWRYQDLEDVRSMDESLWDLNYDDYEE